jgi:hypothetical protein
MLMSAMAMPAVSSVTKAAANFSVLIISSVEIPTAVTGARRDVIER